MNGLGVVEDLLAVAMVRARGITTRVHKLFSMEELSIEERILATRCPLQVSHATLIMILLLGRGHLACRTDRLCQIAGLGAAFHCESVDNNVDVATQAPTIASGPMGSRFLG